MAIDINKLDIGSPKRSRVRQNGWEGFFPYYAGFPSVFAEDIIKSANLSARQIIFDPWNGSGTTTHAASSLGIRSVGYDLNPAMAVVARARTLQASEADSLVSLGRELLERAGRDRQAIDPTDPLLGWFGATTASHLRKIERSAREVLLSDQTRRDPGTLTKISAVASTFYVALFTVCSEAASKYRTSNPTWVRKHRPGNRRIGLPEEILSRRFLAVLQDMATALTLMAVDAKRPADVEISVVDTSKAYPAPGLIDLVLTSPPYCTRIDYTAATRIQLAILHPIMSVPQTDLSRQMTGSIRVPERIPELQESWGGLCHSFLRQVKAHGSKASSGYYFKTHADYFSKMAASLENLSKVIRPDGVAILVVQDSFYKDVHNDLPGILTEMASYRGLRLERRQDFRVSHTIASSHPHASKYRTGTPATEAVLCLRQTNAEGRVGPEGG